MKNPIIQLLAGNYYKKQPMMGHYIKEKYQSKVFTIGFIASQGHFGLHRNKKVKLPKKGTLEWELSQASFDNFLLPLDSTIVKDLKARPLGHQYFKNDISRHMDAVIFNRHMKAPVMDRNFFLKMYPENKYIKPESDSTE